MLLHWHNLQYSILKHVALLTSEYMIQDAIKEILQSERF